jgi:hypothetical protein
MTALTADRKTSYQEGVEIALPVYTNVEIFAGSMVCVGGSHGYAIPGVDASGNQFVGVAMEHVDNTGGASGAKWIRVRRQGVFDFAASSITQAMVGDLMYVVDDQTFDETSPGNNVLCGRLVEYISNTRGKIDIAVAVPVAMVAGGALTIADAGSNFTTDTVEAAFAQLASRLKKARLNPVALTLEDGTALTAYAADPTPGWAQLANKEVVLKWGSHATPGDAAAVFHLPDDLDGGEDVEIHFLAAMSAANDTPEMTMEAYFDAGDTDCAGANDEVDGGVTMTEYVMTIAAVDVPNGPAHLTIILHPKDGEMGTDDLYLYGIWAEYTRLITA